MKIRNLKRTASWIAKEYSSCKSKVLDGNAFLVYNGTFEKQFIFENNDDTFVFYFEHCNFSSLHKIIGDTVFVYSVK